jgi:hypothetical protein
MRLEHIPIPDEVAAEERSWQVVRAAVESRVATPQRRVPRRSLALAAAALAVAAAALSPPGRAVLGSVRTAIGQEHAAVALTRLPAPGQLLVDSPAGPWVVSADGSKRLLGDYAAASWSPHGLYVVATRRNELVTLDPAGRVHWSLARPNVRLARWGGSRADTRIAYLTGSRLHVVAGDGTGDVDACGETAAAPVAPEWRPGPQHVLAYADTRGRISVLDTNACSLSWRSARLPGVRSLAWSADGNRLLVVTRQGLVVFGLSSARPLGRFPMKGVAFAAFGPRDHRVAVVSPQRIMVLDADRPGRAPQWVFGGPGRFGGVSWSPDGRWLLVAWASADQWLFVRADKPHRIVAVGSISEQFGGGPFPRLGGWCCNSLVG